MAKFAVVVFPGSNCDQDCLHVLANVVGVNAEAVWHTCASLEGFDAVVLPGGFSHGDYLRAGAVASVSPVIGAVKTFAEAGGLVLGICNGFQVLLEAGLLPGAMLHNRSARFICEWSNLRIERTDTPFTCAFETGQVVRFPIAHGEGNYYATAPMIEALEGRRQVLFRYVDASGQASAEANPNGAVANTAGVINEAGNVCALMPHPERCAEDILGGTDGLKVFESMVRWLDGGGHHA